MRRTPRLLRLTRRRARERVDEGRVSRDRLVAQDVVGGDTARQPTGVAHTLAGRDTV